MAVGLEILTIETFHGHLTAELRALGQDFDLPKPPPAIVTVYNTLTKEDFEVAPVVYLARGGATYAVVEIVDLPNDLNGIQMYYPYPKKDPLGEILIRGRTIKEIAVPELVQHVPKNSRFGLTSEEICKFVFPAVANMVPHLEKLVIYNDIVLRVPTRGEFDSLQTRYFRLGINTSEHLHDIPAPGYRSIGGYNDSGAVVFGAWPKGFQLPTIGFRLQVVSHRPQTLPGFEDLDLPWVP